MTAMNWPEAARLDHLPGKKDKMPGHLTALPAVTVISGLPDLPARFAQRPERPRLDPAQERGRPMPGN
jgi:hypothetical protein